MASSPNVTELMCHHAACISSVVPPRRGWYALVQSESHQPSTSPIVELHHPEVDPVCSLGDPFPIEIAQELEPAASRSRGAGFERGGSWEHPRSHVNIDGIQGVHPPSKIDQALGVGDVSDSAGRLLH